MIIYPILIAATRIGAIWVRNKVGRNILLSATQVLILMTIIEINKKSKERNDKKDDRGIY